MKRVIILILFLLVSCKQDVVNSDFYVKIYGNSMYPTLLNGKIYKVEKVDGINELKRNDIVIFKINGASKKYIKRLKILPGDNYEISYENKGKILVLNINNNFLLKFSNYRSTKFYKTLLLWSNGTNKGWVKAPQCGVFGDNIKNSIDTLEFGFIGCNKITHRIQNKD